MKAEHNVPRVNRTMAVVAWLVGLSLMGRYVHCAATAGESPWRVLNSDFYRGCWLSTNWSQRYKLVHPAWTFCGISHQSKIGVGLYTDRQSSWHQFAAFAGKRSHQCVASVRYPFWAV